MNYFWKRIGLTWKMRRLRSLGSRCWHPLQITGSQPFFIVSAGRSGSTLLRRMLSAGKDVHIPPESDDFLVLTALEHLDKTRLSWLNQCADQAELYAKTKLEQFWQISEKEYREFLLSIPGHQQTLYSKLWALHSLHRQKFQASANRIGDKTPLLSEWIPLLHSVSPNSRFIYLKRDIRDVIASRMKHFAESIDQAFRRCLFSYRALGKASRIPGISILTIQYETLVLSPESTLQAICAFLDLRYKPEMSVSEFQLSGDISLPHHASVNKPVEAANIGKWRTQLMEQDLARIAYLMKKSRYGESDAYYQSPV